MVAQADNKRRDARFNFVTPALLIRGKRRTQLNTADVSFSGLFLRTDNPPPLRELVSIKLVLPSDEQEVALMGMAVHRVAPGGPRDAGIGILLYGLDPAVRRRWETFVQEVRFGKHGTGPTQDLSWPEAVAPVVKNYRPELKVKLPHNEALRTIRERDLSRKRTFVRTELYLEPNSQVVVLFVHPDSSRVFSVDGVVLQQIRRPGLVGLGLQLNGVDDKLLAAFDDFMKEDVHVTIDVDIDVDFDHFEP